MRLSCGHEIADAEIMRCAASIRSRKRKTHRGGRPPARHSCPRCSAECIVLAMLRAHLSLCPAPPLGEVSADDMAALSWPGPDAA
jgi:hypothetical protein